MSDKPKTAPEGNGAAKEPQSEGAAGQPAAAGAEGAGTAQDKPTLNILAQYVKDLSFENPGAPQSLQPRKEAPAIKINVNVNSNPLSDTDYDVALTINATAEAEGKTVFSTELIYGGVFRMSGFPKEHMLPLLFVECPRLLFPFARQIVAECTRNGGFPPLMIDPIDFGQMFARRIAEEKAKSGVQVS